MTGTKPNKNPAFRKLLFTTNAPEQEDSHRLKTIFFLTNVLVALMATIPGFIITYPYVPGIKIVIAETYNFRIDYILSFAIVFVILFLLTRIFRRIIFGMALMILIILFINLFRNKYSFKDIFVDYKSLVLYLTEEPVKVPFIPEYVSFRNSEKILKAVTYDDPVVRNNAIVASLKYFNDDFHYRKYGNVVRYFSIFKEIKSKWTYIPDPVDKEYYAPANQTLLHFSGDCDDYSIIMAAYIKAVGGETRIVRTMGHVYPEVKVCQGSDLETINALIRDLFYEESLDKAIFFHSDKNGYIWLNFDYTDKYPGGKFMHEKVIDILKI